MKRLIAAAAWIAFSVTLAPGATSAATPEARYTTEFREGGLSLPPLTACGQSVETVFHFPASAEGPVVLEPTIGQVLRNPYHIATVTYAEIEGAPGRFIARFVATGAGELCSPSPHALTERERTIQAMAYEVSYDRRLGAMEITTCGPVRWRKGSTVPRRNGWVVCSTAGTLIRGWKRAAARASTPLMRARVHGFRCVQRADDITCVKGEARATWRAPKPKPPKPKPRPVPGPLGWGEARRAALRIADNFPIYVERRKITWCNRWGAWEVHCSVNGWNTEYDYDLNESFTGDTCSDVAYVTKRPGEFPRVRSGGSLSCIYD